ncbi:MAG: pantoate--beta-alanine ligase [Chloroflexi bacterium]|nr:pantoate--beta-alanine ligase [Chloroflexota bacterium]
MRVVSTISEMRQARRALPEPVGFVPTMGYLHEGHVTLARRARVECTSVVASIFVNPTQFGPNEDFARYPRDLPRDLSLLEPAGVQVVFHPEPSEMYQPGATTYIDVGPTAQRLEGASRPGHFRGVATVVAKLFNVVQPQKAYFGQKDAQQVVVIKKLVADLDIPVDIIVVPTVREPDGLAMSSRNTYLDAQQRQAAPVLWRALCWAQELWQAGERDARRLRREMVSLIEAEPLAQIDYISVAHPETLDELEHIEGPSLVSLAVRIGKTRLIDNITLGGP